MRKPGTSTYLLLLSSFVLVACGSSVAPGVDAGSDLGLGDSSSGDLGGHDLGPDAAMPIDLGSTPEAGDVDLGGPPDGGCVDADHDGHGAIACGGDDCDDTEISIHPGAPEVCDGADNNCDGMIDEGVASTYYRDVDGDGFGDTTMSTRRCSAPVGYSLSPGDCDDTTASIHPGATDTCNCVDDDCDGLVDPGCDCSTCGGSTEPCGPSDGMGGFLMVGPCHPGTQMCIGGTWGSCTGSVSPVAESCNGVDDNCDGTVDEGLTATFYRDADGDGFGNTAMTVAACSAPPGYVVIPNDCDDSTAGVYPGAPEVCNGRDDNCDGLVDEGVGATYYRDADDDGYGTATTTIRACAPPVGYVSTSGDCNDANAAVHPGAPDGAPVCDTIDNNCDGTIDPGCTCVSGTMQACGTSDGMGGFLTRGVCHPGSQTCVGGAWSGCSGSVSPTPESCNGLDDDCDGVVDNGVSVNYYRDCDHDGYGAAGTVPTAGCTPPGVPPTCGGSPGTWVTNNGDCNDASATVRPGATETCNNVDDDCDSVVDGAAASAWCSGTGMPPRCVSGTCVP